MRISKIVGFKSKLTPDYSNVFDGYTNNLEYYNFLKTIYPYAVLYEGNLRSFREENNIIVIDVPALYETIREYNYFVLISDITGEFTGDFKFYFGTSFQSLNDVNGKQVTRVTFEYDSFANNNSVLSNSFDDNYILRRHYNETRIINNGEKLVTRNIITDEDAVKVKPLPTYTEYAVLWAKCMFGNETKVPTPDNGSDYAYKFSSIKELSNTPIAYIPVCVINPKTNKIRKECNVVLPSNDYSLRIRYIFDADGNFVPFYTQGMDLLSIELTYYAPFSWSIGASNELVIDCRMTTANGSNDVGYINTVTGEVNSNVAPAITPNTPPVPIIYQGEDFGIFNSFNKGVNLLWYYNTDENMYDVQFDSFYTMPDLLPSVEIADVMYEPRLNIYPYRFSSYHKNYEFTPLIPHLDSEKFCFEMKVKQYTPSYRIGLSDEIEGIKFTNVTNNGEVVTVIDSSEYYKRNKGYSALMKSFTPLFDISRFSGKTHTPKRGQLTAKYKRTIKNSAIDVVENLYNTGVDYVQSHIQMDTVNLPSINAFDDMYIQDRIDFITFEPEDYYNDYKAAFNFIHKYGIFIDRVESVRKNYHMLFDFVKTSNCDLPFLTNITDRNNIESAYNRGITRWHINNYGLNLVDENSYTNFNTRALNLDETSFDYYNNMEV